MGVIANVCTTLALSGPHAGLQKQNAALLAESVVGQQATFSFPQKQAFVV